MQCIQKLKCYLKKKKKINTRIKNVIKYKSIKWTTMNNSIAWHNAVVWKAWKVSVSKELVISEYLVLNSDASRLFDEVKQTEITKLLCKSNSFDSRRFYSLQNSYDHSRFSHVHQLTRFWHVQCISSTPLNFPFVPNNRIKYRKITIPLSYPLQFVISLSPHIPRNCYNILH